MRLLTNNPDKRAGLEGYGLSIEERIPLQVEPTAENIGYLRTKREKMGHLLDMPESEVIRSPVARGGAVVRTFVGVHDGAGKRVAVIVAPVQRGGDGQAGRRRRRGAPVARRGRRRGSTSRGCPVRSRSRWSPDAWRGRAATTRVICLGAVIRGETAHFELVARRGRTRHRRGRGLRRRRARRSSRCWRPRISPRPSRVRAACTATRGGRRRAPRSRWPG